MPEIPRPFSQRPLSEWIEQLQHASLADDRMRALQAVGLLGAPQEIELWATYALRDLDASVRALGAKLWGSVGLLSNNESADISKGMEPNTSSDVLLVTLLSDADPDVRFESARTLIRRKSPAASRAIPVLLSFLDEAETQPLMIASVINALVELDPTQNVPVETLRPRLQPFLEHDRGEVREALAIALARWPMLAVPWIEQLLPLLDDCEPVVREKIAMALGDAGVKTEEIRTALRFASQDEDVEVARVALQALQKLEATA